MLKFLARESNPKLANALRQSLEDRYENIFNPSLVFLNSEETFVSTIRLLPKGTQPPFRSALIHQKGEHDCEVFDLNEVMEAFGLDVVADPKLFRSGEEVWCTFNDGHRPQVANKIHLLKVYPEIGSPIECVLQPRQRIEKNWAFYREDDRWRALYGIAPTKVIEEAPHSNGNQLRFEYTDAEAPSPYRGYAIGTQLCKVHDAYYFVGHKKINFRKKRAYLGRLFRFNPASRTTEAVSKSFLAHSFRALLGSKPKWNKNLISCTYFSGLSFNSNEQKLYLSYGINDNDFNIASITPPCAS